VRVVALPGDGVETDYAARLDADGVVDEAGDHVLAPHLARLAALEVLVRPGVVVLVHVVGALEEVRDPADAALGQRDLQLRVLLQHA